jgi:D-alanyl-D-alanine carboxypeptidase (penicillin-binding protein 5/6)
MRRPALGAVLLAAALVAPAAGAPQEPPDRFPAAASAYLVELDGRPLWGRQVARPRPPASLTKLMTALLALEADLDPGAWVAVSPRAAGATGARAGLRAGEALRAGDLLAASLLASANDACLALAEHVAGSEAAFVDRMNARAAALGLADTHFSNACGHDAPGHLSSPRDLLRLARAALAHAEVRRLVALEQATVVTRAGRALALRNTNALVGLVEGARGVKSGYTPAAGRCVVALVERRGVELLMVLLDAPVRWWAALGLVELAFEEARRGG